LTWTRCGGRRQQSKIIQRSGLKNESRTHLKKKKQSRMKQEVIEEIQKAFEDIHKECVIKNTLN
jgi:hypothetical protein